MRIVRAALLLCPWLALAGCGADEAPAYEPAVPDVPCLRPELAFASAGPGGAGEGTFGGLDGAMDPGAQAVLRGSGGERIAEVVADDHGRFATTHEAPPGATLTLEVCGVQVDFRVRDPASARAAAVHPSLGGVGAVPNDLVVVGDPADSHGVVVRSGDNALGTVGWREGLDAQPLGVRLPQIEGPDGSVAANPYLVTPLDPAGARVAVSAWSQGLVYVVDLEAGAVERAVPGPERVSLAAPFTLAAPFDVDGDGAPESHVEAFVPSTPQPVAVVQGRLLVGFANILRADLGGEIGQIALPAVIASYDLADLSRPPVVRVLPHLNPQEIRATAGGRALVTCSGLFRIEGVEPETPGAVYRLDPASLEVLDTKALPDVLPTSSLEAAGAVWVSSLAEAVVYRFAWGEADPPEVLRFNDEPVDSVFRLFALPGGLVGVPSFNTDRLHVLDPRTQEKDPAPFFGPLPVGAGGAVREGLQIVAARPGRAGVDFVGPDLMALVGLSASVTPIELRKVLGP